MPFEYLPETQVSKSNPELDAKGKIFRFIKKKLKKATKLIKKIRNTEYYTFKIVIYYLRASKQYKII